MKIKLICGLQTNGGAYAPGQTIDWPNDVEACRFVERGIATMEDGSITPPRRSLDTDTFETAMVAAPENEARRRGRPRKNAAIA